MHEVQTRSTLGWGAVQFYVRQKLRRSMAFTSGDMRLGRPIRATILAFSE